MHEENDDREQDRHCAQAEHCNSKSDVRQENAPVVKNRRERIMSHRSPVAAEGDAVMMKISLGRAADTIGNSRAAAMSFCRYAVCATSALASLQNNDTGNQNRAENDLGNASHFWDGKLPRIECHAGIFGASISIRF